MNQDLISRQAILKHIEKKRQDALMIDDLRESNIIMMGMKLLEEAVRNQPSAQPEHLVKESGNLVKGIVNDCISRQAAIDSVCEVCEYCEYFENEKLIQTIKDLPSAQPESRREWYMHGYRDAQPRWIPVTPETLPNLNSVVVVCGKKGTWDYGTYRGWSGDIHSWHWKKNTIKHVYWWMYKADALPEPWGGGQDGTRD